MLIFDASTLILLAKSDLLDVFLDDFQGIVLVPRAVEVEATFDLSRPDGLLIRQRIREGRLAVEGVSQVEVLAQLTRDFRLGAGEAEALVLALQKEEAVAIATDDRNAIRACKILRIGFVTSLGILTRAVEKGLLTKQEGLRALERLRSYGRFRAEIVEEVIRQIKGADHGESSKNR